MDEKIHPKLQVGNWKPRVGSANNSRDRDPNQVVDQTSSTRRPEQRPLRGRPTPLEPAAERPASLGVQRTPRGRIPHIPARYHPFTRKLVHQAHLTTLHGGVRLTMAKVRTLYWVPRLRRLVKKVRGSCWGCKRFRIQAFQSPPPGNLPSTRTQGDAPYQVIGVDFAGPIRYRSRQKTESKAYLVLYACSLTRGVYLDLVKSLETEEFIASLKRFIARRGRPGLIYSDNGSTFKAAAKWLKTAQTSEKFNDYLAQYSIQWQFNLSRAPWWGGQFERLIGRFKNAFYKSIGKATLRWAELEDMVMDVEIALKL